MGIFGAARGWGAGATNMPADENCQNFDRTDVLLEAGTRAEAEQMIQYNADDQTREKPESKLKSYGSIALTSI